MNLKYFLYEGIIIVIASIVISGFSATSSCILIQKHFTLNLFTGNMPLILSVVVLFSLLGILSGILPLLKQGISNIKSSSDYKNKNNLRRKGISKNIIILQYTISIALIVAVFVIRRQTNYALESSMGVAVPFAFFAMDKWLENFAYKTTLSWWIFALAGLSALFIAVLTVSVQSWKASSRNPVEALRYE